MAPPAAPPLLETTLDDVDRKRHKKQPFDPKYVSFCLSRMGNPDGQPGGGTSSGQPMRSKLQGVDTAASELHARMELIKTMKLALMKQTADALKHAHERGKAPRRQEAGGATCEQGDTGEERLLHEEEDAAAAVGEREACNDAESPELEALQRLYIDLHGEESHDGAAALSSLLAAAPRPFALPNNPNRCSMKQLLLSRKQGAANSGAVAAFRARWLQHSFDAGSAPRALLLRLDALVRRGGKAAGDALLLQQQHQPQQQHPEGSSDGSASAAAAAAGQQAAAPRWLDYAAFMRACMPNQDNLMAELDCDEEDAAAALQQELDEVDLPHYLCNLAPDTTATLPAAAGAPTGAPPAELLAAHLPSPPPQPVPAAFKARQDQQPPAAVLDVWHSGVADEWAADEEVEEEDDLPLVRMVCEGDDLEGHEQCHHQPPGSSGAAAVAPAKPAGWQQLPAAPLEEQAQPLGRQQQADEDQQELPAAAQQAAVGGAAPLAEAQAAEEELEVAPMDVDCPNLSAPQQAAAARVIGGAATQPAIPTRRAVAALLEHPSEATAAVDARPPAMAQQPAKQQPSVPRISLRQTKYELIAEAIRQQAEEAEAAAAAEAAATRAVADAAATNPPAAAASGRKAPVLLQRKRVAVTLGLGGANLPASDAAEEDRISMDEGNHEPPCDAAPLRQRPAAGSLSQHAQQVAADAHQPLLRSTGGRAPVIGRRAPAANTLTFTNTQAGGESREGHGLKEAAGEGGDHYGQPTNEGRGRDTMVVVDEDDGDDDFVHPPARGAAAAAAGSRRLQPISTGAAAGRRGMAALQSSVVTSVRPDQRATRPACDLSAANLAALCEVLHGAAPGCGGGGTAGGKKTAVRCRPARNPELLLHPLPAAPAAGTAPLMPLLDGGQPTWQQQQDPRFRATLSIVQPFLQALLGQKYDRLPAWPPQEPPPQQPTVEAHGGPRQQAWAPALQHHQRRETQAAAVTCGDEAIEEDEYDDCFWAALDDTVRQRQQAGQERQQQEAHGNRGSLQQQQQQQGGGNEEEEYDDSFWEALDEAVGGAAAGSTTGKAAGPAGAAAAVGDAAAAGFEHPAGFGPAPLPWGQPLGPALPDPSAHAFQALIATQCLEAGPAYVAAGDVGPAVARAAVVPPAAGLSGCGVGAAGAAEENEGGQEQDDEEEEEPVVHVLMEAEPEFWGHDDAGGGGGAEQEEEGGRQQAWEEAPAPATQLRTAAAVAHRRAAASGGAQAVTALPGQGAGRGVTAPVAAQAAGDESFEPGAGSLLDASAARREYRSPIMTEGEAPLLPPPLSPQHQQRGAGRAASGGMDSANGCHAAADKRPSSVVQHEAAACTLAVDEGAMDVDGQQAAAPEGSDQEENMEPVVQVQYLDDEYEEVEEEDAHEYGAAGCRRLAGAEEGGAWGLGSGDDAGQLEAAAAAGAEEEEEPVVALCFMEEDEEDGDVGIDWAGGWPDDDAGGWAAAGNTMGSTAAGATAAAMGMLPAGGGAAAGSGVGGTAARQKQRQLREARVRAFIAQLRRAHSRSRIDLKALMAFLAGHIRAHFGLPAAANAAAETGASEADASSGQEPVAASAQQQQQQQRRRPEPLRLQQLVACALADKQRLFGDMEVTPHRLLLALLSLAHQNNNAAALMRQQQQAAGKEGRHESLDEGAAAGGDEETAAPSGAHAWVDARSIVELYTAAAGADVAIVLHSLTK